MATTSAIDVVMPQMGVSVSEGTITKWLKQEGEPVAADESLLEISTDKVDTEVPSPGEGVLQQILVQEGETVEVGTKLAVIAPEGATSARNPLPASSLKSASADVKLPFSAGDVFPRTRSSVKMICLPSGVQVGWVARVSLSPKWVTWVKPIPSGRIV